MPSRFQTATCRSTLHRNCSSAYFNHCKINSVACKLEDKDFPRPGIDSYVTEIDRPVTGPNVLPLDAGIWPGGLDTMRVIRTVDHGLQKKG
jgi:hypothetical protein